MALGTASVKDPIKVSAIHAIPKTGSELAAMGCPQKCDVGTNEICGCQLAEKMITLSAPPLTRGVFSDALKQFGITELSEQALEIYREYVFGVLFTAYSEQLLALSREIDNIQRQHEDPGEFLMKSSRYTQNRSEILQEIYRQVDEYCSAG